MTVNCDSADIDDFKICVADSAVFIMGNIDFDPLSTITIPEVENEMKSEDARLRFDLAKESGLRIEAPSAEFLEIVRKEAAATRDNAVLSDTDLKIISKALEHKDDAVLLTDDFAVQNVAVRLGIPVKPIAQKTIKDKIIWQVRCTGCGRHFTSGDVCPVCGSPMKRKMKHKKPVKGNNGQNMQNGQYGQNGPNARNFGNAPKSIFAKKSRDSNIDDGSADIDNDFDDDFDDDFDYASCLISKKSL